MRENQISNVPAAVQTSRLMTYAEVAEWTGCCVKTIRSYCKKGGLPCIQFGRKVRFEPEKVAEWLQSRKYVFGIEKDS